MGYWEIRRAGRYSSREMNHRLAVSEIIDSPMSIGCLKLQSIALFGCPLCNDVAHDSEM